MKQEENNLQVEVKNRRVSERAYFHSQCDVVARIEWEIWWLTHMYASARNAYLLIFHDGCP
jgi:hypothetical protein